MQITLKAFELQTDDTKQAKKLLKALETLAKPLREELGETTDGMPMAQGTPQEWAVLQLARDWAAVIPENRVFRLSVHPTCLTGLIAGLNKAGYKALADHLDALDNEDLGEVETPVTLADL